MNNETVLATLAAAQDHVVLEGHVDVFAIVEEMRRIIVNLAALSEELSVIVANKNDEIWKLKEAMRNVIPIPDHQRDMDTCCNNAVAQTLAIVPQIDSLLTHEGGAQKIDAIKLLRETVTFHPLGLKAAKFAIEDRMDDLKVS